MNLELKSALKTMNLCCTFAFMFLPPCVHWIERVGIQQKKSALTGWFLGSTPKCKHELPLKNEIPMESRNISGFSNYYQITPQTIYHYSIVFKTR